MDSLKQDQQEQRTGSAEESPSCEIHDTPMLFYATEYICEQCQKIKSEAAWAHRDLNLPERLQRCSFNNYNPVNKKAEAIKVRCLEYVHEWTTDLGGIIMLGSVGTGKTHLATAICKAVCDTGNKTLLTTIPVIIRTIRSSWNQNKTDQWGSSLSEDDIIRDYSHKWKLLVIDEIGTQYGSDSEKVIISEIINNRYNNLLPTMIIGNTTLFPR